MRVPKLRLPSIPAVVALSLLASTLVLPAPASAQASPVSHPELDPEVARGKRVLYVMNFRELDHARAAVPADPALVRRREAGQEADRQKIERLKSLGFIVTTTDEFGSIDQAKDKDLIVIAESVQAQEAMYRYTDLPIPIVCWENDIYDDLRMTGKRLGGDYGANNKDDKPQKLRVVNAAHPLSGGLSLGTHDVWTQPTETNWGKPGLGAIIIATLVDEPEKVAVFGYEKGATMDYDFVAPARRVGLFMLENDIALFSKPGLTLFDAAHLWAVSPPEAAPASVARGKGKQVLYVMSSDAEANDRKIIERLRSMGLTVKTADERMSADAARGKDLVVISDSVSAAAMAGPLRDTLRQLPVPVVTWDSELYPHLSMTGSQAGTDFGTEVNRYAWMVNAPHPLNAGLRTDVIQDLYHPAATALTNWGKAAQGAVNIAVTPGVPDQKTIFAYERGASMADDRPAPARRVGLFFSTYRFGNVLPTGLALFDAALLWAMGSPADAESQPASGVARAPAR